MLYHYNASMLPMMPFCPVQKKCRCCVASSKAMKDWKGQGFLHTQTLIDGANVMVCEALYRTKSYPYVDNFTQSSEVLKHANKDCHHICVNCVHQTVCATILK